MFEDYINNYEYSFLKDAISVYNPAAGRPFENYSEPIGGNK